MAVLAAILRVRGGRARMWPWKGSSQGRLAGLRPHPPARQASGSAALDTCRHLPARLVCCQQTTIWARAASTSAGVHPSESPDSLWAANRITLIGAGVNVTAAATKAAAGIYVSSPGLISDAAHSLSDVASDLVTLWAVNHARVPASHSTPWGLGKLEAVGGSVCAGIIFTTGVAVGAHSALDLHAHAFVAGHEAASASEPLALLGAASAAAVGILAKEWLYRESLRIGHETRSTTMIANAWHHRTDAFSSILALAGIAGTSVGFPMLDSVAGLAVAVMITRVGAEMGYSAYQELIDSQVDADTLRCVQELITADGDVIRCSHIRGRKLGPYIAVELRMQVPFDMSVSAGQQVATKAKLRVLEGMPEVYDVVISVDAEKPISEDFGRSVVVGGIVAPREHDLMRSPRDIERDVRAALVLHSSHDRKCLWGLSHTNVHWRSKDRAAFVEACLILDPSVPVREAHRIARGARAAVIAFVPDIAEVDLHLELFDKGKYAMKPGDIPSEYQLPDEETAREILKASCSSRFGPNGAVHASGPSGSGPRPVSSCGL